jgi:H+-transporting ATPase
MVASKPLPKNDLKSIPLPEVQKKLESSPDGLTQAEADKRLMHLASIAPHPP